MKVSMLHLAHGGHTQYTIMVTGSISCSQSYIHDFAICPPHAAVAEAIPLEEIGEPAIKILNPSTSEPERPIIFVTPL